MKSNIIEEYVKMVKQQINNLTSTDDFIEALYNDLSEYTENNPNCTLEEIIDTFGRPEDIAKDFLSEVEELNLRKIAKAKRRRGVIIAGLIVLLILGGIYLADILSQTQTMATDVITVYE
ncbi:putative membrane protein [Clostridiales Family XIII bacterium PM5-7]